MNRDHLYIIKSGFQHEGHGPYYCPGCAEMVGLLEFYPELKEHVEIHWVDFARPRPELVELLGAENQSCPVLVLAAAPANLPSGLIIHSAHGRSFIEGTREIGLYLAHVRGTGRPFPP
ncbi:DUF3088 domain-containing protein [Horticoccus luteus]|uniref:DUF3088 domain-containing protein n=1 Tax=Horticoccus luteus TaxID=2862869 RepID=A0A8F9TTT0_9BACT|nr:DUF3088 family protein [Horticoccus luteus]QYM78900.1 DUF3088 domain-containing protein [Horticoccus luteus]